MSKEKKHADFQDRYTKSSNFTKKTKNMDLKPDGKGNLVRKKDLNSLSDSEKENIASAMDKMRHNIEMIPGDHRDQEE
ncbi:MAG: hypothetical protein HKN40_10640 [Winogradskyella sp.]|uniref:hypothetical protein n=1 Tax=Winogradskyella sp. TaxID=1883156 RepID=UPI0018123176|nr:hypothetical protein [Winogradskyella sp.]